MLNGNFAANLSGRLVEIKWWQLGSGASRAFIVRTQTAQSSRKGSSLECRYWNSERYWPPGSISLINHFAIPNVLSTVNPYLLRCVP